MQHATLPEFVIDAWHLSGQGSTPIHQLQVLQSGDWYHCQREHKALPSWLNQLGIPSAIVEALLAEDTRPRFEQLGQDAFFLIVRGVNLNQGVEPDDMLALRLLYWRGALITLRRAPFQAISVLREELALGAGPRDISELLCSVLEQLHQRIEAVIFNIEDQLEALDDERDKLSKKGHQQLRDAQRRLLRLKRFLYPQQHALEAFEQAPLNALSHIAQQLNTQRNIAQRINEHIAFLLEMQSSMQDFFAHQIGERMNRNTYLLSLFSGIFLPLGFFTGLFGINVAGLPGTESDSAFWWFCASMGIIGITEFVLLWRLRFW